MAGMTKAQRRYLMAFRAFEIIQRDAPIRAIEIVDRLWIENGIRTSPAKLGKALLPFVRDDQLVKVAKNDGRYYSVGNQAIDTIH